MYSFDGDICQRSEQTNLLRRYGYHVDSSLYPAVETEDEFKRVLSLIWTMKCDGWWHYLTQYIKYNICTKYEYLRSLYKFEPIPITWFIRERDILQVEGYEDNAVNHKWFDLIKKGQITVNGKVLTSQQEPGKPIEYVYDEVVYNSDCKISFKNGDLFTVEGREYTIK